jgi:hypothetical protein
LAGTDAEWAQYVKSIKESLRGLEREVDEQRRAHGNTLRSAVERELNPLKEAVEAAQAALLEAEPALARQREIDDYVASRSEAFVNARTREEQTAYNTALKMREEARREAQRRREAQQRAWWAEVETHPIDSVVEKLPSVPAEYVQAVMRRLLTLSATDPHVHDENIHRFLLAHRQFASGLEVSAPVVVASIGRLVATGDDETARSLLDLCPAADRSPLAGVVAYLGYVLREGPDLSGIMAYQSLTAGDLFLGACYYEGCRGDATAAVGVGVPVARTLPSGGDEGWRYEVPQRLQGPRATAEDCGTRLPGGRRPVAWCGHGAGAT